MAKKYRTAQGKVVDFNALISQNETVPAIGNMNVNARGDYIDSSGEIVKSREDVMREYHKLNTMVPTDERIPQSSDEIFEDEDEQEDVEDDELGPTGTPVRSETDETSETQPDATSSKKMRVTSSSNNKETE